MPCKSNDPKCPCNRCTKGWHSRRHETREAQDEAFEQYRRRAEGRPKQRWNAAAKRWDKAAA